MDRGSLVRLFLSLAVAALTYNVFSPAPMGRVSQPAPAPAAPPCEPSGFLGLGCKGDGCMRRGWRCVRKQQTEATGKTVDTVEGRWILDASRSESLEPFLIAVGAPYLVAKLVGKRGKPMAIGIDGEHVTVQVEGKDAEKFGPRPTDVPTPRGAVRATLTRHRGGFGVVKRGPAEGEVVTEEYELVEAGRVLRSTFTHARPNEQTVTVVRYYARGFLTLI